MAKKNKVLTPGQERAVAAAGRDPRVYVLVHELPNSLIVLNLMTREHEIIEKKEAESHG